MNSPKQDAPAEEKKEGEDAAAAKAGSPDKQPERDENGTLINWTEEMKTQFPDSKEAGDGKDGSAAAKANAQESIPEFPEDGGDSPEASKARQFKSQEYELKQKTSSEE